MNLQTYTLLLGVVTIGTLFGVLAGISSGNVFAPGIALSLGIVLAALLHRRVSAVMDDELLERISGKAAIRVLEVIIIAGAIIGCGAFTFYWNGGNGTGMAVSGNGSISVTAAEFFPHGTIISNQKYVIADPSHITMNDLVALDTLFTGSHRVRDYPYVAGMASGVVVILIALLYAAFLLYYHSRYETGKT